MVSTPPSMAWAKGIIPRLSYHSVGDGQYPRPRALFSTGTISSSIACHRRTFQISCHWVISSPPAHVQSLTCHPGSRSNHPTAREIGYHQSVTYHGYIYQRPSCTGST